MSSNNQSTTRSDPTGRIYTTPAPGPAPSGTPIVVQTSNGPVSGTLVDGYAITNKQR